MNITVLLFFKYRTTHNTSRSLFLTISMQIACGISMQSLEATTDCRRMIINELSLSQNLQKIWQKVFQNNLLLTFHFDRVVAVPKFCQFDNLTWSRASRKTQKQFENVQTIDHALHNKLSCKSIDAKKQQGGQSKSKIF